MKKDPTQPLSRSLPHEPLSVPLPLPHEPLSVPLPLHHEPLSLAATHIGQFRQAPAARSTPRSSPRSAPPSPPARIGAPAVHHPAWLARVSAATPNLVGIRLFGDGEASGRRIRHWRGLDPGRVDGGQRALGAVASKQGRGHGLQARGVPEAPPCPRVLHQARPGALLPQRRHLHQARPAHRAARVCPAAGVCADDEGVDAEEVPGLLIRGRARGLQERDWRIARNCFRRIRPCPACKCFSCASPCRHNT